MRRAKSNKAWAGRFAEETSPLTEAFTQSISFDWILYEQDIRGSIAHARMLRKVRLITAAECNRIIQGLKAIQKEIALGKFRFDASMEDVHMHIEAALIQKIGEAGRKLHTARSRNDQVATDFRMWIREQIPALVEALRILQKTLVRKAAQHVDVVMPGQTHLQHAQPVLFAHHFLAYVEMMERDRQRFSDCQKRVNVMPLGSGALAGTTLPIDRALAAQELDFPKISQNSMDAVSDRDFCVEFLFVITLTATHLSRLAEDLILWTSAPFGYVSLSDAHCTGSSMMPQKKNPDTLELIRGKTGRAAGNLMALLNTLKGLPMTYNRDLQEDKEPVFDSFRSLLTCMEIASETIAGMRLHRKNIDDHLRRGFLDATVLADYLVLKKIPFRRAHAIVGKLVALCIEKQCMLKDLTLPAMRRVEKKIDRDVYQVLGMENCVRAYRGRGSSAPAEVKKQIIRWERKLRA